MSVLALPEHSPLGASGAHQWMVCAGSINESVGWVDEESEYASLGGAAHVVAEHCLKNKIEPWTMIGDYVCDDRIVAVKDIPPEEEQEGYELIDKNMVDAVAIYIDHINDWHPDRHQGNSWIERKFHCPEIHPLFFGTSDFVYLDEDGVLHIWDYKHGIGIVVEATDNPQAMYYAAGVIEDLGIWDTVTKIVIHIVQPRGWHFDGAHRTWELSPDELDAWLFDDCVAAMKLAEISRDTIAGGHCMFCPARQAQCPSIMAAMHEFEQLVILVMENSTATKVKDMETEAKEGAKALTNEQLGRLLDLQKLSAIVTKAGKSTAHSRLSTGQDIPGVKMVKSRTNREYKDGDVEKAAKKEFGSKCMTDPKLKSPAQIDEMPEGKKFTARWAFKPEGATTVAVDGDPRRRVNRDAKSLFKPVDK